MLLQLGCHQRKIFSIFKILIFSVSPPCGDVGNEEVLLFLQSPARWSPAKNHPPPASPCHPVPTANLFVIAHQPPHALCIACITFYLFVLAVLPVLPTSLLMLLPLITLHCCPSYSSFCLSHFYPAASLYCLYCLLPLCIACIAFYLFVLPFNSLYCLYCLLPLCIASPADHVAVQTFAFGLTDLTKQNKKAQNDGEQIFLGQTCKSFSQLFKCLVLYFLTLPSWPFLVRHWPQLTFLEQTPNMQIDLHQLRFNHHSIRQHPDQKCCWVQIIISRSLSEQRPIIWLKPICCIRRQFDQIAECIWLFVQTKCKMSNLPHQRDEEGWQAQKPNICKLIHTINN